MIFRMPAYLAAVSFFLSASVTAGIAADAATAGPEPTSFPATSDDAGLDFGIVAGGFAFITPAYEGSDEYRVSGFPLIYPKFYGDGSGLGDRLTLRGLDDVRFAALRYRGLEVGPVAGYTFGREEDAADLLDGIGDVDAGFVLGAYAGYTFEPFFLDAAYIRQVTGEDDTGYQVKLSGGTETTLNERLDLTSTLSAVYASDDYMQSYFGISPAQEAASTAGLTAYDAEAGFKSVGLDFAFDYQLTQRASVKTSVGYSRLIGDAADSPVTASQDQFRGGLGFTYTFGRVR